MDLFYVLINIQDFSEDATIYAEKPWCLESNAKVLTVLEVELLKNENLEYFLEVGHVDELLIAYASYNACLREQCWKIIEYAQQNLV